MSGYSSWSILDFEESLQHSVTVSVFPSFLTDSWKVMFKPQKFQGFKHI
jgi:hypothetical protein